MLKNSGFFEPNFWAFQRRIIQRWYVQLSRGVLLGCGKASMGCSKSGKPGSLLWTCAHTCTLGLPTGLFSPPTSWKSWRRHSARPTTLMCTPGKCWLWKLSSLKTEYRCLGSLFSFLEILQRTCFSHTQWVNPQPPLDSLTHSRWHTNSGSLAVGITMLESFCMFIPRRCFL